MKDFNAIERLLRFLVKGTILLKNQLISELFDNKSGDKSYSTYCLNCICNALELIPNLPAFVKQGLNLLCSLIPSPVSLISGKFFFTIKHDYQQVFKAL